MNTVTELRLAIQARGFSPIPVCGKKPLLPVWQTKAGADAAEIIAWGSFPEWPNTGILTEYTPAADIDIRHSEAAMRVEDVARERFGSYGTFLTRFGEVPKRCVLFRTDTPFAKIAAHFRAPDGSTHKIEILCGGQQVVVAGIHPDTKKPYSWHADRGPWSVSRDDLPEIDESEARAFVEQAAAVLEKEFEFVRIYPGGNGHTPAGEREPVNVGGEFAAMTDGASVNDAQCRIIPSRLRAGEHPDDVLQLVVDGTMAATGNKLGWSRDVEVRAVIRRILSAYRNLLLRDYDPATGVIPPWLPGDFHARWIEVLQLKRRPDVGYNAGGFYVRGWAKQKQKDDTGTENADQNVGGSPHEQSKARSGWNFYDNTEIRPPRWLVKQLLPQTGVGILSGQWGSFKTTAALDLSVAVMTGQLFAGQYRIKRPGAVLYIATEGAGTLQSRLAAIARHRGAPAKLPFAWRSDCPLLTDRAAGTVIAKYIDDAAAHFEHTYGVPIVLIWIDTYITAAGLHSSGDDNDVAATQKAFNTLRFVASHSGAFVATVDHHGKVIEAGTRGSSNKEGNADTVLATLAEREVTGAVANTRMAARKQRDGISGFEVPFTPESIELGLDEDGDSITAIVLDWGKQQHRQPAGHRRKSKDAELLCRVLAEVVAKHGFPFQPDPGGPIVQACHGAELQTAFFERRLTGGTARQQQDKRAKAYRRALAAAVAGALVGVRDMNNDQIIWARRE